MGVHTDSPVKKFNNYRLIADENERAMTARLQRDENLVKKISENMRQLIFVFLQRGLRDYQQQ
jgi:hypothetical protein